MTVDAGVAELAERLRSFCAPRGGFVAGLTGSVASGKSTLAGQLVDRLTPELHVEAVSTDGFLFSNAELERRGLPERKGFPESYDRESLARAIAELRRGEALFPGYSHEIYDTDPAADRLVKRPDLLILEGLGHSAPSAPPRCSGEPDLLIYVDAAFEDLESWYTERFVRLWRAAEHDPGSFYRRFRQMSEEEVVAFSRQVWEAVNLPNLTEHIAPLRERADLVVLKRADHSLVVTADRSESLLR